MDADALKLLFLVSALAKQNHDLLVNNFSDKNSDRGVEYERNEQWTMGTGSNDKTN